MLLRDVKKDIKFKNRLTEFIGPKCIKFQELQEYLAADHSYAGLGKIFKLFGQNRMKEARDRYERYRQLSFGTDSDAFFLLHGLLGLTQDVNGDGEVCYSDLGPDHKMDFLWALEHSYALSPNDSVKNTLIELEVDAICSGAVQMIRLGKYGNSRLGDFLVDGPDQVREFALEQFERLHRSGIVAYDDEYPALVFASTVTNAERLRQRIRRVMRRIEKDNPTATLPVIAKNIITATQTGTQPVDAFRLRTAGKHLSNLDFCTLSLGVAEQLRGLGKREASVEILSEGTKYASRSKKHLAWIGISLGDRLGAAKALFDYAHDLPDNRFYSHVEQYHAIEAACRLLYQGDRNVLNHELQSQLKRFDAIGKKDVSAALQIWRSSVDGFDSYLTSRIAAARTITFDHREVRMSQRATAERHFLEGVVGSLGRHLVHGIEWFERSAIGNDAPWIEGERCLLQAIKESLNVLKATAMSRRVQASHRKVEQGFIKAAESLNSSYPFALSLIYRALINSKEQVTSLSVRDLTLAIEMLDPETPEIEELRNRTTQARWNVIESFGSTGRLSLSTVRRLWMRIAALAPLTSRVIDESSRLKAHFAPTRNLRLTHSIALNLDEVVAIEDANERGLLLERLVTEMIEASEGLRVLDVRHRNSFEEIDIIVSLISDVPMLSYWGPLILVECKNWKKKIGVDSVRSFYTKMITKKGAVRLGLLISPSGFTKGITELTRLFQDVLILTIGPEELTKISKGSVSFLALIEELIPKTLFA